MSKYSPKYIYKVYLDTMTYFGLTPTEALLMHLLAALARRRGWCYASKTHLSQLLNISPPTVYKVLSTLESKKLIVRNPGYSMGSKVSLVSPTLKWSDFITECEFKLGHDGNTEP